MTAAGRPPWVKSSVVGSTDTDMTVRVARIPAPGGTILGHDFQVTGGGQDAGQPET